MGQKTDYSYYGEGIIYARAAGGKLRDIGNCSALNLAMEEEEQALRNFRGGGGNRNKIRRPTDVTVTITMHDLSPENLEMVLRGTVSDVSVTTVTEEEHVVVEGALNRLDALPDHDEDIVITNDAGDTTYEENADYRLTPSGFIPLADGDIDDGETVKVDYTKRPQAIVQALMTSAVDMEMVFEGMNEARSGAPVVVSLWRARLGAPEDIEWIGDDYASLSVPADLLADTARPAGTSQFFQVEMATAA